MPWDSNLGLTQEQIRLLELLASGCTSADAAARLGLAPRTAERRLAEARAALGAKTNAQALVRAGLAATGGRSGRLTRRQQQVLALVAEGLRDDEIAERLGIARSTVASVLRAAMAALGTRTRAQAVARLAEKA